MTLAEPLPSDDLLILGDNTLARLILDEAQRNPDFARRVSVELLAATCHEAPIRTIERYLSILETKKGLVCDDRQVDFLQNLSAIVAAILVEMAPTNKMGALKLLLRFIDTWSLFFIKNSEARNEFENIYWRAGRAAVIVLERLSIVDKYLFVSLFTESLTSEVHGSIVHLGRTLAQLLSPHILAEWFEALKNIDVPSQGAIEVTQVVANLVGDQNDYLLLESHKAQTPWSENSVAEKLLAAGQFEQALQWVESRKEEGFVTYNDTIQKGKKRHSDLAGARLEAAILDDRVAQGVANEHLNHRRIFLQIAVEDASKDRERAQVLRWEAFEATLDAEILRDYVQKLDVHSVRKAEQTAIALVESSNFPERALAFFITWPRFDLAAMLVIENRGNWSGIDCGLLGHAAETLEIEFPIASIILYRRLLDNILSSRKYWRYGCGSHYLARLDALATIVPEGDGLQRHPDYLSKINDTLIPSQKYWLGVNRSSSPTRKSQDLREFLGEDCRP